MTETVEVVDVEKSFSGVRVLGPLNWSFRRGEVHVLAGENGSGKSTLLKILAGIYHADGGTVMIDGAPRRFHTAAEAVRHGIAMVSQETQLAPSLSIAENICLNRQRVGHKTRLVSWRATRREAEAALSALGRKMDTRRKVGSLGPEERQIVAIARALASQANIVLMDKPTAALSEASVRELFRVVEVLRQRQVALVYVTHRLAEVFAIGDRVTVLRDGQLVGTVPCCESSPDEVVRMMVGRPIKELYHRGRTFSDKTILSTRNLSAQGIHDIDLNVREGEILGLAGLLGSGRSELLHAIFGDLSLAGGEVYLGEKRIRIRGPRDAVKHGIVLIPSDRKRLGVVGCRSVRENLALGQLQSRSRTNLITKRKELAEVRHLLSELDVRARSLEMPIMRLSGGNQQKCILARWLSIKPTVFLLDEPTQGIDVGAREQIYEQLNAIASQGRSVVVSLGDLPELLGMCHRIVVMNRGRVVAEVAGEEATEEVIV